MTSKNIPSEVLIYVQKVKKYIKENVETFDYFLKDIDEDLFFKYLLDVSIKNFKNFNDPILTKIQFELLNKTIRAICVVNKPYFEIWWDLGIESKSKIMGKICLN
jgi:hypothetical protein